MIRFPSAFFVTGTDTVVGKTFVCALLMAGLKGSYWKPIQSGGEISDTDYVKQVTGLDGSHFLKEVYKLKRPLSPHAAAMLEGISIEMNKISIRTRIDVEPGIEVGHNTIAERNGATPTDRSPLLAEHLPGKVFPLPLIVEGSGGLMAPINETQFMIDVIKKLRLPVLIVARSTLGTINHTVLTVRQLRAYQIEILGVIMNGPLNRLNREAIEHYGSVPVIAETARIRDVNPASLETLFQQKFSSYTPVQAITAPPTVPGHAIHSQRDIFRI